MPRLILFLVVVGIIFVVYQRTSVLPAAQRKKAFLKIGLAVLVGLVLILTITGRMHWLGAAITALLVGASRALPVLLRLFPVLQWVHRQRSGSASGSGQQSNVETALLRMVLDHESGDIHGEVLEGDFAGRQLDELEQAQLEELLSWCRNRDADSARLLESYLQSRFENAQDYRQTPPQDGGGNMGRTEALAVLGLAEDASDEEITSAHRSLMQKLHPDRGGNDYLAAKLNQAKDTLLG